MARAIWSGSISFGLVNVPVKAFTAVHDHKVHFHRLEKGSGARIRNQQVSDKSGKPVESDDVELGYELTKGHYVTFESDEIDRLRPSSTRSIDVSDFVPLEDIDPVFYEHTYWLAPDGDAAEKAYGLLLAAMTDQQRVGIGSVVMRTKQYLAAIRPFDGALAMSTMRFADEVVSRSDIDQLPRSIPKPSANELKLANQIVDALAGDWKPDTYHDTFTEELRDLITRKGKGEEIVVEESDEGDHDADVIDLMAALQASVDQARSPRRKSRAGSRKKAATKKAASKKAPSHAKGKGSKGAASGAGTKKKSASTRSATASARRPRSKSA